jgi:DNA-binding Lrp family transcriptional regulator
MSDREKNDFAKKINDQLDSARSLIKSVNEADLGEQQKINLEAIQDFIKKSEEAVRERLNRLLSIKGKRTVMSFHRELGKLMWEYCGMGRNAAGLAQQANEFLPEAICLVDVNGDGVLDMVFNNEGQESCVLLGNPEWGQKMTPLVVQVKGKDGVVGSRVRVLDKDGKLQGSHVVSGGDGRGGQASPAARFALKPGTYKVEVLYSTGVKRMKEIEVASTAAKGVIDETSPILKDG